MASNRKRSNSSIGNKINRIDSKVARTEKSTQGPHIDPEGISAEHLGTESVSERSIAARAITEDKLARGVVGTEHLGVVNEITSDSNLAFNAGPGRIILNGQQYATTPPSGTLYTLAFNSDGEIVVAPLSPGESAEGNTSTFRRSLPPTGLTASSVGVWTENGEASSVIMLDWDAVTTGVDGQPITATMYEVFYRDEGTAEASSQLLVSTSGLEVNVAPMPIDKTYYLKIRAYSSEGAWSNFSPEVAVETLSPVASLLAPSTPLASAQPGVVTVSWDGLLGGNTPPSHFSHVFVGIATSEGGTYAPIGQSLVSTGSVSISGLPDGAVRWFKLYAMDRRGSISPASAGASVTVISAASSDVIEGLVEDMEDQATQIESIRVSANGKNQTYRQPETPPGTAYAVNDTWFDTNDGGKIYNWDGAAWQPIQFGLPALDDAVTDAIADAQSAAAGAVSAANGKNKVWFQDDQPPLTGNSIGDTWFDTNDGNKIYSWSGSAWIAQVINTSALASTIVTDISTAKANASTALTNAATADGKAVQATTDAAAAQARADLAAFATFSVERDTAKTNQWLRSIVFMTTTNGTIPTYAHILGKAAQTSYVADSTNLSASAGDQYVGMYRTIVNVAATKTISFTGKHDDGGRVYVDGVAVYSNGLSNSVGTVISFSLTAGWHVIDLMWAEQTGLDGWTGITPSISSQVTSMFAPVSLESRAADAAQALTNAQTAQTAAETAATAAGTAQTTANNAATAAQAAATAAGTAQTTADGKNTVWYQTSAPPLTGNKTNDVWFDTDDGNKMYRWNGAWTAQQLGTGAIADSAIDATKLGTAVNTAITTAGTNASTALTNAATAQTAAATAQAAADAAKADAVSRGRVYSQPTAPDAGTRYAWLGTPYASKSTKTDAFGVKTNEFTNGAAKASTALVTVRQNLIASPRAAASTPWGTQWYGSGASGTTTFGAFGPEGRPAMRKTWTVKGVGSQDLGVNYLMPQGSIVAGKTYSFSAWSRASWQTTHIMTITWLDSAGATISNAAASPKWTMAAGVETTLQRPGLVAPTGATAARVIWGPYPAAPDTMVVPDVGATLDSADLMVVEGTSTEPYFDGSSAAAGDYVYGWVGTVNNSLSNQRGYVVPGWAQDAGTALSTLYASSEQSRSGQSLKAISKNGGGDLGFSVVITGLKVNTKYTFSYWVYSMDVRNAALDASPVVEANGMGFRLIPAQVWTKFSTTFTTTAAAGNRSFWAHHRNGPGADGRVAYFDNLMIIEGDASTEEYFDGDFADDRLYDYWVNTTDGLNKPNVWDSTTNAWVPATDKVAADAAIAAATAQAKADQAFADAAAAATAAGTAQTAANGKNRVWYQDAEPAGIGHAVGDTWFDTNDSNKPYRWTGSVWSGMSFGSNAISDLAINSSKLADLAVDTAKLSTAVATSITTAQSTATTAQTTANGKNQVTYSLSVPSNTTNPGTRAGDVWFRRGGVGNNEIIGQWEWDGSAWLSRTLTDAVITNLNAATVTAGVLSADRIGARTITADKVVIGDSSNMAPDPKLQFGSAQWAATVTSVASAPTANFAIVLTGAGPGTFPSAYMRDVIPVVPGQELYFSCYSQRTTDGTATVRLKFTTKAGATISNVGSNAAASWGLIEGSAVVPANAAFVQMWVEYAGATAGNNAWFTDFTLRVKANGKLIVDGAITTLKLDADAVTAAKIAVGSITASKAIIADSAILRAQIADLAVDNAKIANLDGAKITAQTITGVQIAAKTITAGKMTIADPTNLVDDPLFQAPTTAWQVVAGGTGVATATESANLVWAFTGTAAKRLDNLADFDTEPGAQYYISVTVKNLLTIPLQGGIRWATQDNTFLSLTPVDIATTNSAYTTYGVTVTAPANARRGRVSLSTASGGTGAGAYVSAISVRRRNTGQLIVDGAITANKIDVDAVTAGKIAADAVTAREILAGTITAASGIIADAAIGTAKIADLAVTTAKMANLSVTNAKIDDLAVTNGKIANLAVDNAKIALLAVTDANIANINAAKITAGTIDAQRIGAQTISTTKLIVADFTNLLEDPSFEANSGAIPALGWDYSATNVTNVTTTPRTGARTLRIKASTAAYQAARQTNAIRVEAGEKYVFGAWIRAEGAGVTIAGGLELGVDHGTVEATTTTQVAVAASPVVAATYTYFSGIFTVPAGAKFIRPRIHVRSDLGNTNVYLVDDLTFYKQVPGVLIQDGAITAGSAIIGNLAVSGAMIANATIQFGKIVSLDASTISTGTMSGDYITAGTIKVGKLAVTDTSNLSQINEAQAGQVTYGGVTDTTVAGWSGRSSNVAAQFMFRNQVGPLNFKTGDQIRVTMEAYATVATSATVGMWVYGDVTATQNLATFALTTTGQTFTATATVTVDTNNKTSFHVGFSDVAGKTVFVRNVRIYRMNAGELLVDGSLNAFKIIGGNIQTVDQAARGVKFNSAGIQAYSNTGVQTVSIDGATGNVGITGTINATAGTITGTLLLSGAGAKLKTDATASRGVEFDSLGLRSWNSTGTAKPFEIDAATGAVSITGTINATGGTFSGTVNMNGAFASLVVQGGAGIQVYDGSVTARGPNAYFSAIDTSTTEGTGGRQVLIGEGQMRVYSSHPLYGNGWGGSGPEGGGIAGIVDPLAEPGHTTDPSDFQSRRGLLWLRGGVVTSGGISNPDYTYENTGVIVGQQYDRNTVPFTNAAPLVNLWSKAVSFGSLSLGSGGITVKDTTLAASLGDVAIVKSGTDSGIYIKKSGAWTSDIVRPTLGTFSLGGSFQKHASWQGIVLEKVGNRVHFHGTINNVASLLLTSGQAYVMGTIPVGFRPATGKQVFQPGASSPGIASWVGAYASGTVEFALLNGGTMAAGAWILGFDLWWDIA